MLEFPRWKYFLILIVLAVSALYALPNVYQKDPSVQITAGRGAQLDDAFKQRAGGLVLRVLLHQLTTKGLGQHQRAQALGLGSPATAEALFRGSELPIADFYKQLALEVAQGHIADGGTTLEARHAVG